MAAGGQYNDRLSLVVDYNRTGYVGPYGGDYFVPDAPLEGSQLYSVYNAVIGFPISFCFSSLRASITYVFVQKSS